MAAPRFPSDLELAVHIAQFARNSANHIDSLPKQSFGYDVKDLVYVKSITSGGYGFRRVSEEVVSRRDFLLFKGLFKELNLPFITMGQHSDEQNDTFWDDAIDAVICGEEEPLRFLFAVSRGVSMESGVILDTWKGRTCPDQLCVELKENEVADYDEFPSFSIEVCLQAWREHATTDYRALPTENPLEAYLALYPGRDCARIRQLLSLPWARIEVNDSTFRVYYTNEPKVKRVRRDSLMSHLNVLCPTTH